MVPSKATHTVIAAFRLRGMGVYGLDVQGSQGAGELSQFAFALGVIDAEDTVFVAVQRDGSPILLQILCQGLQVSLSGFSRYKSQGQQTTGGVINEHDQSARLRPPLRSRERKHHNDSIYRYFTTIIQ